MNIKRAAGLTHTKRSGLSHGVLGLRCCAPLLLTRKSNACTAACAHCSSERPGPAKRKGCIICGSGGLRTRSPPITVLKISKALIDCHFNSSAFRLVYCCSPVLAFSETETACQVAVCYFIFFPQKRRNQIDVQSARSARRSHVTDLF